MARKLKTYQTSLGFFDQAVAAPSMKAALEAWGAESNLFHQGVAKETDDPDIVAATMAKPGVVLRRPVGSDGPFKEDARLPTDLPGGRSRKPTKDRSKPKKHPARKSDTKAERQAALAFEREQARRRKEEAAREKEREHRQREIDKAQAALDKAEREHDERVAAIETDRAAIDQRSQAEEARWEKLKEKLKEAVRRARE
jgi:colicin import membrane protein